MRILIVEDNRNHRELLEEGLSKIRDAVLAPVTSEREFIELWDEIESEPPDIALIDVMLRWDFARRDMTHPDPDRHIHDVGAQPFAGNLEGGLGAGGGLEEKVDLRAPAQHRLLFLDLSADGYFGLGEIEQGSDLGGVEPFNA